MPIVQSDAHNAAPVSVDALRRDSKAGQDEMHQAKEERLGERKRLKLLVRIPRVWDGWWQILY